MGSSPFWRMKLQRRLPRGPLRPSSGDLLRIARVPGGTPEEPEANEGSRVDVLNAMRTSLPERPARSVERKEEPRAKLGPQPRAIGTNAIWVLPNPSGLNAHLTSCDL